MPWRKCHAYLCLSLTFDRLSQMSIQNGRLNAHSDIDCRSATQSVFIQNILQPEDPLSEIFYGFSLFGPRKINMASLMFKPRSSMVSLSTPSPKPP